MKYLYEILCNKEVHNLKYIKKHAIKNNRLVLKQLNYNSKNPTDRIFLLHQDVLYECINGMFEEPNNLLGY